MGGQECHFAVVGNPDLADDMYILGNTFMREYYMIFDYDNGRIGLNGDIEPVIPIYKDPLSFAGLRLWAVILLTIGAIGILLGIIAYLFIKCKYSRL